MDQMRISIAMIEHKQMWKRSLNRVISGLDLADSSEADNYLYSKNDR
jgi:hypothetical protein